MTSPLPSSRTSTPSHPVTLEPIRSTDPNPQTWPADWPDDGPIELDIHDLPHASSQTEWWYVNAHFNTPDGRNLALFASFFRIVSGRDEATKELQHAHSATWALVDLDAKRYYHESRVDKEAPRLGLDKLERGEGTKDPRLRRALREILERGNVPYPDHMFDGDVFVHDRRLDLDFDGLRFWKDDAGHYHLECWHEYFKCGAKLTFAPTKGPIRHGDNGLVKGVAGEDMFYYFVPRCSVTGTVTLEATHHGVEGSGWYDHEFGGHRFNETSNAPPSDDSGTQSSLAMAEDVAWNWCALQLDDGRDLTAYAMVDLRDDSDLGQRALLIDAEGVRHEYLSVDFIGHDFWTSTRTFNNYPTRWELIVPQAKIALTIEAVFADQEFVTLISKPAFWEGRVEVRGTINGEAVSGRGWIERSGFVEIRALDDFFRAVSKETRKSVANLLPLAPTYEQVRGLIASEARDHYMEGVDLEQFVDTGVRPIRAITDRGGKAWRSYAALACCDVVGGDSREFVQWLAMPELMHVGSLIVDDVQDRSTVRRGGPPCHSMYGDALAINAGTAAYFMGQQLVHSSRVSNADKLRLYDNYFEALRAGHAGQAADIRGLDSYMDELVETGDNRRVEKAVLAIHRLKTAAPAASLSRMGAIAGGGTETQIEALGAYFESLGLAFQIIDDVLNLRGFKGELKLRGEDIAHGKVTLPTAKAMGMLQRADRQWLWDAVKARPQSQEAIDVVIQKLEACGAVEACVTQANTMVEEAWQRLQPEIEDSIVSLMLRAFGWYVLQRHY